MNEEHIDWDRQAEEFLRLHGWKQEPENPFNPLAWGHPAFPLMEDVKAYGGTEKFVEESYAEMWKVYKSFISSAVMLEEESDPVVEEIERTVNRVDFMKETSEAKAIMKLRDLTDRANEGNLAENVKESIQVILSFAPRRVREEYMKAYYTNVIKYKVLEAL